MLFRFGENILGVCFRRILWRLGKKLQEPRRFLCDLADSVGEHYDVVTALDLHADALGVDAFHQSDWGGGGFYSEYGRVALYE